MLITSWKFDILPRYFQFSLHQYQTVVENVYFPGKANNRGADWPFPCDSLSVWKWAGLRILVFGAAWTPGGLGKRRVKGCRSMLWRECHKVSAFQSPWSWIADKILGWFGYQEAGLEIRRWKQVPHPERKKISNHKITSPWPTMTSSSSPPICHQRC